MCMPNPFELAVRFGVQVIEVPAQLPRPVLFVREHSLAFVSADLDPGDRQAAADWLLAAALLDPDSLQ